MRNIFVVTLLFSHTTSLIQSTSMDSECANYTGTRPYIWPLNTAFPHYLSEEDYRRSSLRGDLSTSTDFAFHLKQFNCTHDRPVHWVFHLDPAETSTTVEWGFSERIRLTGTTIARYNYSTNFRLIYLFREIPQSMLLSCEPVHLTDKCERNFIQVINKNFNLKPVSIPHDSLSSLSESLLKSSTERIAPQFSKWKECPIRLYFQAEAGNIIRFKWRISDGSTSGLEASDMQSTNESSFLNNVFRLNTASQGVEVNCVQVLGENIRCEDCKLVEELNYTTNAIVFYAMRDNLTLFYRGMFSVPKGNIAERKFCAFGIYDLYFDWKISEQVIQEEMIQLEAPSEVYANIPTMVKCRVSVFQFAYGTVITDQTSPELEEVSSKEIFSEYGYREVRRSMAFDVGNYSGVVQAKNITCFAPLMNSEKWVTRKATVFVDVATIPSIDDSPENLTESRTISPKMYPVLLECNASGNPIPSLKWIIPSKNNLNSKLEQTYLNNSIRLEFPKWESIFAGTYVCEAQNFLGVTTKTITLLNENQVVKESNKTVIIVVSTLGAITLILGGAIGFVVWKIRKQRRDFEEQTQHAVEQFRNGLNIDLADDEDIEDLNRSVLQLPYNENFEMTRDNWDIEDKILGSGQFGIVRMGRVSVRGEKIKVAVKTMKSTIEIDDFKSFLFELKIMAYLGQHRNIVSLIAACTEGINDRDVLIGVEYCDNGCLLEYLRKYKGTYQSMVTPDGKLESDVSAIDWGSLYVNLSKISTHDIYRWSYHIACGMDYLSVRKVLHGDLAARNVLLTSRKVAKVGDFGLSRVLTNSENYTKQSQTALPWKWMAIESLRHRVFSTNSDVWSYGITLYELFTVGQTPYPGIGWSPDFITKLENGMRMERPANCPISIYKVMKECWEHEPHNRANYAKIKRKLSKGLRRLKALIATQKQQQVSKPPGTSRTQSTSSPVPEIAEDELEQIETLQVEGIYSNLPRRTMNYYKNY